MIFQELTNYRSEGWTLKKDDQGRLEAAEMWFHLRMLWTSRMEKRANKSISGWSASALHRELDAALRQLLTFCGLKMSVFKGFRIGAASAAAFRGESDAQV